jgi:hypothetical protein
MNKVVNLLLRALKLQPCTSSIRSRTTQRAVPGQGGENGIQPVTRLAPLPRHRQSRARLYADTRSRVSSVQFLMKSSPNRSGPRSGDIAPRLSRSRLVTASRADWAILETKSMAFRGRDAFRRRGYRQSAGIHQSPGVAGLQGEAGDRGRLRFLQSSWSPAYRIMGAGLGAALTMWGIRQAPNPFGSAVDWPRTATRGATNLAPTIVGTAAGRRHHSSQDVFDAPVEQVFEVGQVRGFPRFMQNVQEARDLGNARLTGSPRPGTTVVGFREPRI